MPEGTVIKLAEDLLPKLRVAEWRDRAEAAQRQMEHLDLRDLRSVVVAANDPMVARDESTSALAAELTVALATKQEQELSLWFGDIDAALAVGRVVRALRLSSQPPKAGVPFPADIAQRLVDSTNASLAPMDSPERWIAMLEAAAFSPVRSQIAPARKPDVVNDELLATVKRLAPALPLVAALFEVEVDPKAPMPKPLRQGPRRGKDADRKGGDRQRRSTQGSDRHGSDKQASDKQASDKQGSEQQSADREPSEAKQSSDASDGEPIAADATQPAASEAPASDAPVADAPEASAIEPPAPSQEVADDESPASDATATEAAADAQADAAPEPETLEPAPSTDEA